MWGSDKSDIRKRAGVTLIANNCEIVGDVRFTDELHINGVIKGNVLAERGSKAKVTVSEHGSVQGEIRVPSVVINGEVVGDVHSDKHIELAAKARVTGSVYYKLIEMVLGAQVDGKLVHVADAQRGENLAVAPGVEPEPVVRDTQRVAQTIGGG